jgi:hypothetical protein
MAKPAEHLESPVTVLKPQGTSMTIFLPQGIHEYLRNLAAEHERSLSREVRWVLKRYSEDPQAFGE